jgi:hypothetical protein
MPKQIELDKLIDAVVGHPIDGWTDHPVTYEAQIRDHTITISYTNDFTIEADGVQIRVDSEGIRNQDRITEYKFQLRRFQYRKDCEAINDILKDFSKSTQAFRTKKLDSLVDAIIGAPLDTWIHEHTTFSAQVNDHWVKLLYGCGFMVEVDGRRITVDTTGTCNRDRLSAFRAKLHDFHMKKR